MDSTIVLSMSIREPPAAVVEAGRSLMAGDPFHVLLAAEAAG